MYYIVNMSTKKKIINDNKNEESIRNDNSINVNEITNNNTDEKNANCIEKSYDIIKALVNENDLYKEEAYGFKYVCDEQKKKIKKLNDDYSSLKYENDKLNNQLKLHEQQKGGINDSIMNIIKNYNKNLTEDRKREIQNKYKKYIYDDVNISN